MPLPTVLPSLTPREAITDALHRCLLGIDSNDHALFASACLQTPDLTFTGAGYTLEGWKALDDFAAVLFDRTTMHMTSNLRIEIADGAHVAKLNCQAIAYHMRPEEAMRPGDTSFTAGNLYDMEMVREEGSEGVWRIKTWKVQMLWFTGDREVMH